MQKQINSETNYITILGPTGDLGSQLANYLIEQQKRILLVFRKGHLEKLKSRIRLNNKIQIIEVDTLFDFNLLNKIIRTSKLIFNLTGLVSLSFSENVYPHILIINGFFPGLLARYGNKLQTPIIYASTQRMKIVNKRRDIKIWTSGAIREFNNFIDETNIETDFENSALVFAKKFLLNHPIPSNINIYELSKALGETMLRQSNNSIILRISSCYGLGCSTRRTVGRLIFSRLFGQEATEKEEIRDFLYIQDLNEIFKKLINFRPGKPYIRYCCSGTNTSKSYIITKILEKTPNENGVLKISDYNNAEIFKPSGRWLKNTLGKNPTQLDEGLVKTIKNIEKLYFSKNSMSTTERLSVLYDQIKQKVDEQGINPQEVVAIRNRFFTNHNDKWEAHESFWKPTGLVLGYPFPEDLGGKFISLGKEILTKLGLEYSQYWFQDKNLLHITIISYSHYSEAGMNVISLPLTEVAKAREIIRNYKPIDISFRGVLITNNGSLLIKGFVNDEDLFLLRGKLTADIKGITQQRQNLIHVKLAQILDDVPYELIESVNRLYSSTNLGRYVFSNAKTPQGELLKFKSF